MVANERACYLTTAASFTCDSVPTRSSLLSRLRNAGDEASWRFFFETYWALIYNVARKSGLADSDAQDIVQETVIAVARKMPAFRYDAAKGSFKQWLLLVTRRRIHDHFRRAYRAQVLLGGASSAGGSGQRDLEQVPSPALAPDAEIDAAWETEWRESLFQAALARVRQRANPKQYQAFDYCVLQGLKAAEAARRLGMSAAQVYLAKHRISVAVKRIAQELERQGVRSAGLNL
ncbi:MAG: sigma-70 family RNA polymerase sigma factor [Verrucomicrobiota bacterium]|jgi:RNA polymerase sigma-70 factor (ECF subfamily)